jgi:hypothetical protein
MTGSQPVRPIGLRTGMVVLAALLVLIWRPALAGASQKVISTAGPFSAIYINEDLDCQAQASGDLEPSFYGSTEVGGCGTFLALTAGEDVSDGLHVFGPSPAAGDVATEADFRPQSQTLTGSGTEATPFVVTTQVGVFEPDDNEFEVAELTETDTYVTGAESYETKITVKNLGDSELEGTLYHIGDCFLANLDTGFGAHNMPSPGSVACTIDPNDTPPARYMAFTPIATSGFPVSSASYVESQYPTFWQDVQATGPPLPDTIDTTTNEDNGMGLSWPLRLSIASSPAAQHEATLALTTTVSPSSPPTSSTSAGACVASGQVPVTVSAVNGAAAVDYVLDGVVGVVPVNEAGQATIVLSPGQHTLEYWGQDLTGAQETPHHVLSVTVATGGPHVTITSDQNRSGYEVGEAGSVTIAASGPGLTSDPSAAHVPISTATPGTFTVARTATNACGTTAASFVYTVVPPPVLGKTVNVELVSGKVFIALPTTGHTSLAGPLDTATESLSKGLKFVPLTEARQIPVGSTLDTTAGVARITTATSTAGKLQSGNFGAGIFKLLQSRKQKGLTELNLIDNHTAKQVCGSFGKKAQAAAKHLSGKVLGRLTGSDHGGRFTTKGQYSAATVRGTVWSMANQCDGTLTKVTRGAVVVRDFHRRKTITLFAGQSYLAKAP